MNNQTPLHVHLTQHQPRSKASGCWPAWSCSFIQLARGVCTIWAARRREQRNIGPPIQGCLHSPSKGMPCWPGQPDHMQLAVFPGIGMGCTAPGPPGSWSSSCQAHVAAGAAGAGPDSRREAQVMAASAAKDSHSTAKAKGKNEVLQILGLVS